MMSALPLIGLPKRDSLEIDAIDTSRLLCRMIRDVKY